MQHNDQYNKKRKTKYIYSNTVLKYNFKVLVFYLNKTS